MKEANGLLSIQVNGLKRGRVEEVWDIRAEGIRKLKTFAVVCELAYKCKEETLVIHSVSKLYLEEILKKRGWNRDSGSGSGYGLATLWGCPKCTAGETEVR